MSIASQLQKQYQKPRPKLSLGVSSDSSSALTLLSTSSSVRSFSIGGGASLRKLQEEKQQQAQEDESKDSGRAAPEPADEPAEAKSNNTFESDRYLAAMWLKSRCGPSHGADPKTPLFHPPGKASASSKPATAFAAKKNSIVRQCSHCQVLYTAGHACALQNK